MTFSKHIFTQLQFLIDWLEIFNGDELYNFDQTI